jgi:hypothetical protein
LSWASGSGWQIDIILATKHKTTHFSAHGSRYMTAMPQPGTRQALRPVAAHRGKNGCAISLSAQSHACAGSGGEAGIGELVRQRFSTVT